MSLRDKIIFFGIIIALFSVVMFVYIFPAENILKNDEKKRQLVNLNSPGVACSTLDNFVNMRNFLENNDNISAKKYLDTKKCERLEQGTAVKIIDPAGPDTLIVQPKGRPIHLYISSSTLEQ